LTNHADLLFTFGMKAPPSRGRYKFMGYRALVLVRESDGMEQRCP